MYVCSRIWQIGKNVFFLQAIRGTRRLNMGKIGGRTGSGWDLGRRWVPSAPRRGAQGRDGMGARGAHDGFQVLSPGPCATISHVACAKGIAKAIASLWPGVIRIVLAAMGSRIPADLGTGRRERHIIHHIGAPAFKARSEPSRD